MLLNRGQSGIATVWGPNSLERACFSLSYSVNTRQATPLSVQCAKPQEFPLSVSLSLFLFQSLPDSRLLRSTNGRSWQEDYWTSKKKPQISFSHLLDIPLYILLPLSFLCTLLTQTAFTSCSDQRLSFDAAPNRDMNVMKLLHRSVMMEGEKGLLELLMNSFFPSFASLSVQSCKQGLCWTLAGIVGDTWANLALIS